MDDDTQQPEVISSSTIAMRKHILGPGSKHRPLAIREHAGTNLSEIFPHSTFNFDTVFQHSDCIPNSLNDKLRNIRKRFA